MRSRLGDRLALVLIPILGSVLIRLLGLTWRFTQVRREEAEGNRANGQPCIYALWHGRMLPLMYLYRNRGVYALVSQHRDGELAVRMVHKLGYRTVRGSSTRGGARGFQDLLRELEKGSDVTIMPDGPRGPARNVQPGVLRLAMHSGCPIIPITAGASRSYTLKSWDSFMIPKPFSRCVVIYDKPVTMPADSPQHLIDEQQAELEHTLNRITDEADTFFK
jgi:lysophospholipid acyltransferase (LPLAT)-like uncharacterized protein